MISHFGVFYNFDGNHLFDMFLTQWFRTCYSFSQVYVYGLCWPICVYVSVFCFFFHCKCSKVPQVGSVGLILLLHFTQVVPN